MSDFGKEVAKVYRDIKESVEKMPVNTSDSSPDYGIDRSVKEEVISDLDKLIDKNEKR